MARPFLSGQIQVSLVSFVVKLFPATETKSEIRFDEIGRKTGERARHHKVSESDDVPVEKDDIGKGKERAPEHGKTFLKTSTRGAEKRRKSA